jgi:hypothetical protein
MILLHLSNMITQASTSDLPVTMSYTILSSQGIIASPCLKSLLTSNSEDKCLLILNLAYILFCKILHHLTYFGGKSILCISLNISFHHTVLYAA